MPVVSVVLRTVFLLGVALVCDVSSAVDVEGNDTLAFDASAEYGFHSNLFALPSGERPVGLEQRSATTRTWSVGLRLDKTYGLQRVIIDGSLDRYQYEPFSNLDFTGHDLTSALLWHVTPDISGNVFFDRKKTPTKFENTGFRTTPDPRVNDLTRLDVDWRAGAALHPRLSAFETKSSSEVPNFQVENSKVRSTELSLIYQFRSGNELAGYARRANGTNANNDGPPIVFEDRNFREYEYGVRGLWEAKGLYRLEGNIGYLDRDFRTFSVRSFDGAVGSVRYRYALTGKTELRLEALRTLASTQTSSASYCQCDTASAGVAWTATGKITLLPTYAFRRKDYKGPPVAVSRTLLETTHETNLQILWDVARSLHVSLNVGRARRVANDASLNYSDRTASVLVRGDF